MSRLLEKYQINIWMYGILKSRGQGPKKMENYRTNLFRTFKKNLDIVPWIGKNHTFKCWSGIFPKIIIYMIMLENCQKQHFSLWLFSNTGDNILFMLKFYEARISEWNVIVWDLNWNPRNHPKLLSQKSWYLRVLNGPFVMGFWNLNQFIEQKINWKSVGI